MPEQMAVFSTFIHIEYTFACLWNNNRFVEGLALPICLVINVHQY